MRTLALTLVALFAAAGCDGAFGRSTTESAAPAASAAPSCCPISSGSASAETHPGAAAPAAAATVTDGSGKACDKDSPECRKDCEGMTDAECEEACEEACEVELPKDCEKGPCPKSSEPATPAR